MTCRIEHHHHHTNNTLNKTLHHHHKLGEEAKEAAANCAVVTNAGPRQKPRPAASLSNTSNSTMGNHPQETHTVVDPLCQRSINRALPSQRQRRTLNLATLRGGLASPAASHSTLPASLLREMPLPNPATA
jgi:hypothetical protein